MSTESETKTCPFCAETYQTTALICPHCRERVGYGAPLGTHRNRPGKQVAGVAIALADALGVSVTALRLLFVITTFINFVGIFAYVLFWLVLPEEPGESSILGKLIHNTGERQGEPSIFERIVRQCRVWLEKAEQWLRSKRESKNSPPPPPTTSDTSGEQTS